MSPDVAEIRAQLETMARRGQDEERREVQKNLALAGPPPAQIAARLANAEQRIAQLELQVRDLANRVDAARRIAVDARDAADPRHYDERSGR